MGALSGVHAMTDITGFGLLGHAIELCEGSHVHASIAFADVPVIPEALTYLAEGCYPDGSFRNWKSYAHKVSGASAMDRMMLLSDPQTSGGLLVAVAPEALSTVSNLLADAGVAHKVIGTLSATSAGASVIDVV